MLRYSVNLSMLFKEVPFLERFEQTAKAGFEAVEFLWPAGTDLDDLVRAQQASGLKVALFNVDAGDMPGGDRGFANWPDRVDWWRGRFEVALELAGRLGCPQMNALVGNEIPGMAAEVQTECLLKNLAWAAPRARADRVGIAIEALNRFEHPRYPYNRTAQVVELLNQLGEPNVKLQYDVYHMQRMEGNLVPTIRANAARIGHIQIADAPDRHQPGTGELNYPYILAQIDATGYEGFVGLEYNPLGSSDESFAWLPREQRRPR